MEYITLSATELDVLELLWAAGKALSRPEILERMPHKPKSVNAIHQVLNSLMAKDLIHVEGMVLCSKIYGRTYAPVLSREEFLIRRAEEVLPGLSPRTRLVKLVSALTETDELDEETIEELEKLLEARRQELGKK